MRELRFDEAVPALSRQCGLRLAALTLPSLRAGPLPLPHGSAERERGLARLRPPRIMTYNPAAGGPGFEAGARCCERLTLFQPPIASTGRPRRCGRGR
jgi:hypothetical protein